MNKKRIQSRSKHNNNNNKLEIVVKIYLKLLYDAMNRKSKNFALKHF